MQNDNYHQRSNAQNRHDQRGLRAELPVVDEFAENHVATELIAHDSEETVVLGMVTDCTKLNVREGPNVDSDIVCEIPKLTEVMINDGVSTDEFYKICTDSGVEGFCMKKHITVRQ